MIQPILFAYFVIKWIGAWSQFEGSTATFLYSILCVSGILIFLVGLTGRGTVVSLGALINNGAIGIFVGPILWILFFMFYANGLVDWLVNWNILETNQGYLMSDATPSTVDIVILAVTILLFVSPLFRLVKIMRED